MTLIPLLDKRPKIKLISHNKKYLSGNWQGQRYIYIYTLSTSHIKFETASKQWVISFNLGKNLVK